MVTPSLCSERVETRNSPYINRFLQPDTVIPDLSNPQSWNRFSYVTNRPVNFNDPSGHKETDSLMSDGAPCLRGDLACQLGREEAMEDFEARQKSYKEKGDRNGACSSTDSFMMTFDECYFLKEIPTDKPSIVKDLPAGRLSQENIYALLDALGWQNWWIQKLADLPLSYLPLGDFNLGPFGLSDFDFLNDPAGTTQYGNDAVRYLIMEEVANQGSVVISYEYHIYTNHFDPPPISTGYLTMAGTSESAYPPLSTNLYNGDADTVASWFLNLFTR